MQRPAISASATASSRTHADRPAPTDISGSELAILRRRDVALYPLILISVGAFALAISQALRPAGQEDVSWASPLILIGSTTFGTLVGLFALAQERGWGRRFLGAVWFYFLGASLLLAGLATVALVDRGLSSAGYGAVMLVSSYVGLVFPRIWSRIGVIGLLGLSGAIQALRPDADYLEAGTVFVLIVVGWLVGLLPRIGHQNASRHALLLSRSDSLTGALNRRGFLEQFAHGVDASAAAGEALALLVIDLNGFKAINDEQGHAAGDEILAWVGQTVPQVMPARAAFGRLGGDEFAVLLYGFDGPSATVKAIEIRTALSDRIGASVGVSTHPDGFGDTETLMQAADSALYAAKADPSQRVQYARADPAPPAQPGARRARRPSLTYEELVAAGGPPTSTGPGVFDGRFMIAGFFLIALSGIPIVGHMFVFGGHEFFEDVIRYLGIPWALANLALGVVYRNHDAFVDPPRLPWYLSAVLVGGGVGADALATGHGITATIMGAFIIKILFDASMATPRRSAQNFAIMLGLWAVVVVLSPGATRWAAPYQALLLAGALMLGTIGRAAFEAARTSRIHIASTDALTGLLNRRGLEMAAEEWLAEADAGRVTLGVVSFDLDDFKGINDTLGHAAGDQLLRAVAHLTRDSLTGAYAIARPGGDEFVALVPVPSLGTLIDQLADLDTGLSVLVGGSIGSAVHGADGGTLEALLAVADQRAYAVKQSRPGRRGARAPRREPEPGAVS